VPGVRYSARARPIAARLHHRPPGARRGNDHDDPDPAARKADQLDWRAQPAASTAGWPTRTSDAQIASFTNLYGCRIGAESRIGPFVEIQRGGSVGARCKTQNHTFIGESVEIHDEVFVGHGAMFVNDKHPRATSVSGALQNDADWELLRTVFARGVSVGRARSCSAASAWAPVHWSARAAWSRRM
jgi:hypothetical protein